MKWNNFAPGLRSRCFLSFFYEWPVHVCSCFYSIVYVIYVNKFCANLKAIQFPFPCAVMRISSTRRMYYTYELYQHYHCILASIIARGKYINKNYERCVMSVYNATRKSTLRCVSVKSAINTP